MGNSLLAPWLKQEGLKQIRTWRAQGLTQKETAQAMGVSVSTLQRWARQHPALRAALQSEAAPGNSTSDSPQAAACEEQTPCAAIIPACPPTGSPSPVCPENEHGISIRIAPLPDPYPFAKAAGLDPLSPQADPQVLERLMESALLRRALGCCYATVTSELRKDPVTGEMVMTVTKRVDKEVPPDTSAQLFWLKTHAPERWRDKGGDESDGDGEVLVTFDVDEEDDTDWEDEE